MLDARLATLPASPTATTIVPAAPTDLLRAAYLAEAADRREEAAAGFLRASDTELEPAHLAHAGDLLWTGDPVAARRAWARARASFDERGASLELVPVETWFTSRGAWVGEQLALLRGLTPINGLGLAASYLQLHAPGQPGPGTPPRKLYFPEASRVLAFTADGQTVIRDDGPRVIVQDLVTGLVERRLDTGTAIAALAVIGSGEALQVLSAGGQTAALWGPRGRLGSYTIAGTTPTITRVYRGGEGNYHDNILRDDPTWVVSVALAGDGQTIALGGSDSKIRIFDRDGRERHTLAFAWPYVEHRRRGGNPDLNLPMALHIDATGKQLLAIHTHGDLITWDLRSGRAVRHISGRCSAAEANADINRYASPDDPGRSPTAAEAVDCGRAAVAQIAPDGAHVATAGIHGIRVRSRAGAPLAMFTAAGLPQQTLAIAADGAVATTDIYGAVAMWRPGEATIQSLRSPDPSGPIDPKITTDGRQLRFGADKLDYTWDLTRRQRSESPRDLGIDLASALLSPDGRWRAELRHDAPLAIHDTRTDTVAHRSTHSVKQYGAHTVDFARDSSCVVWIEPIEPRKPGLRVHFTPLTTGARASVLELGGWPGAVSLSPDAAEVLILVQDGTLTRWRPDTGETLVHTEPALAGIHDVTIADDARTVLLAGFHRIEIRANDPHLTPLARLFPLLGGGWLVKSTAGAVDGSDDAVDNLVTRVRSSTDSLLFDGHLGWDAAHVPGLLARALAGENVPPPVLYRAPPPVSP